MRFRTVSIIFLAALGAEIFALSTGNAIIEIAAKPALMPILMAYFSSNTKGTTRLRNTIIAALFFSWLGDVFLLIEKYSGGMFVYGLGAFLAAHVAYIWYFVKVRKINGVKKLPGVFVFVAIAFYSSAMFMFLLPFVEDLFVPVAIYSIALSTMLATSFAAFRLREQNFGKFCVAGTLLFVVSDSILAINRFAIPFPTAPILVMLTYGVAQFLICEGAKRNLARNSEL